MNEANAGPQQAPAVSEGMKLEKGELAQTQLDQDTAKPETEGNTEAKDGTGTGDASTAVQDEDQNDGRRDGNVEEALEFPSQQLQQHTETEKGEETNNQNENEKPSSASIELKDTDESVENLESEVEDPSMVSSEEEIPDPSLPEP